MRNYCARRGLWIIVVWVWMFLGSFIAVVLTAYLVGTSLTLEMIISILNERPYLAVYGEIVGVGALPLIISLLCNDSPRMYGLSKSGILISLTLSVPPSLIILLARLIHGVLRYESFNLSFPYNIWYAIIGVLAYGPLEVFFVIWLIVNTDYVLGSLDKIFSPGLIITVLAFGLSHIILSPKGGIFNAIEVTVIFLFLGLIFKYTRNSLGSMIAWTLINGQVSSLLVGCLT